MKFAGTGLRHQLHIGARHHAVFGLVVAEQHLDFGNRIHAHTHHAIGVVAGGVDGHAVNREVGAILALAVDVDVPECPIQRVFAGAVVYSRQQFQQAGKFPILNKKVLHLSTGDNAGPL